MSLVRSGPAFRASAVALVVSVLAALGPVAVARPASVLAADPPGPTPVGSSVTIHGRGYGHGVGMNQYGARGRALAGQSSTEILAHYYQGATLGSIPLDTLIRVRVLNGFKASSTRPLVLYGRRAAWRFEGSDTYDTYRGALRIGLKTTAPLASATNELKLERYLRGVVPAEMPSTWPVEALRAQAIAARSYAARRLRPGESYYDVPDDSSSQVYLGVLGEKPATTAVIDATPGVVLKSGSSIANTLFHSTGGGATEHNENVYVSATGKKVAGPVSYLRGSLDRREDGTAFDDAAPYATWKTKTYTRTQLSTWFGSDSRTRVGTLTALDLSNRGVSGRLISVTLVGSLGTKTVSGNVFREVFNANRPAGDPSMRSTLFDLKPVP
jgi:stage II sporulation protein D